MTEKPVEAFFHGVVGIHFLIFRNRTVQIILRVFISIYVLLKQIRVIF